MKNLIALIVILVSAYSLQAAPKLEIVGGDTYDWGKQSSTKGTLKAQMVLKNIGNETLKIFSVNPNCGCTTAPLSKYDIAPGDTAVLDISLNISTYTGDVKKGIDLNTNDPEAAKKHLPLKTFVIRPLTTFPSYMNFGNMNVTKEALTKVILTNSTDLPIKIIKVEKYPEDLMLNIKDGDELPPNADFTFEAKYVPKEIGRFMANVKLRTNNPDVPELILNGFGTISEPLNTK